ncbi:MAG: bacteriochlorophyll 4-vinyl reductase [Xanthobacteraceae bacterium]
MRDTRAIAAATAARIGPNAITRMTEALAAEIGEAATGRLYARAGLSNYLSAPPREMVPEEDVVTLHRLVRHELGRDRAARVGAVAGRRTGDYLLAHRIPQLAQVLLRLMPRRLAASMLVRAIARNAWTFVGSGMFAAEAGAHVCITIADCPLCRNAHASAPLCSYYAATFERLFRALVHPRATVVETQCRGAGDRACVFEVH